jgi:hypothetical protein
MIFRDAVDERRQQFGAFHFGQFAILLVLMILWR